MNCQLEEISCIICGENNTEIIIKDIDKEDSVNLVLCRNCGLAFLNPRWTKEGYNNYYENSYDNKYRPNTNVATNLTKVSPIIERLKRNSLITSKPINVLDIGCGNGENLLHFAKFNASNKLFGIEPSVNSQKQLDKTGIMFLSNDVDSEWHQEYTEFFDIIIMRHVLEHFLNPLAVLKKIRTTLKADGILYIAVPNNLNMNRLKGWARIPHTYYFNKYSLSNILQLAGFRYSKIVEGDAFNLHEVFLFASSEQNPKSPIYSEEHYRNQKQVFVHVLKREKSPIYKLQKLIRKITH